MKNTRPKTPTAVGRTVPRGNPNHYASIHARAKRASVLVPEPVPDACWVPLAGGYFALVDSEDYERTMQFNWCSYKNGNRRYAQSDHVPLHHFILGVKGEIDHKNGNGLDNRKSNLRPCTKHENMRNVAKAQNPKSSCYKGVSYQQGIAKWKAEITFNGRRSYLGVFVDEEKAARAYDAAAVRLFGEFARLNFPLEVEK